MIYISLGLSIIALCISFANLGYRYGFNKGYEQALFETIQVLDEKKREYMNEC